MINNRRTIEDKDGKRWEVDTFGNMRYVGSAEEIKKMLVPVRCLHCGQTYDLADTTPIHRYADATTFRTPCCNVMADDRRWKSMPDFVEL